jgi:hypothetical protein
MASHNYHPCHDHSYASVQRTHFFFIYILILFYLTQVISEDNLKPISSADASKAEL